MATTAARQQQRRRTATQWNSENPVLAAGEQGVESDTQGQKVGDGSTAWNSLKYTTAHRGDLTMQTPTITGGTATNGVIRGTHAIQMPWTYTQSTDPSDSAVGTGVLVDAEVTLSAGGAFGPSFQTGYFGPRGVFQFEGLVRYGANLSTLSLAPVGYGDFVTVANTAGSARSLNYAWAFLAARTVLADGATVTLVGTDVNDGGAAFVDSSIYATVDTGTIDGTTNSYEHVSYLSMPGIGGNSAITRRVGFDVLGAYEGAHPSVSEPTGAHWSGAGNWDATTPTLSEEIGLRVQGFNLGASKIGIQVFPTSMTNLSTSPVIGVEVGLAGNVVTLNDTGGGFRTGNDFKGVQVSPTIAFDQDGGALGAFTAFGAQPVIKNVNAEARTIPLSQGQTQRFTYRGDGALLTVSSHVGLDDVLAADIVSSGTVSITASATVQSGVSIGTGATLVTRKGFMFNDGTGAGSVTNQIGIDIAALAKGGTLNIGIRNASTEVATPSVQTLTAVGNTITPNAKVKRLDNTSGSSLTLTSNPHISDGQDGQILVLFNSSANDVVLTDGNGVQLGAATRTIGQRDTLMLLYSTTIGDWIELGFVGTN